MKKIMLILLCTLMMMPSFVGAHTSLSTSNPTEGQVVTENLEQIILTFATTIEELSTMDLLMDGNVIPLEEIKVENKQLMGKLAKPLENGSYTIQWKIVGEGGHPIKGEINFVVQMDENNEAETNPVTPDDSEINQEDEIQSNQQEKETGVETVEDTADQNNNTSSTMLITVFIILIVIFGIVLLLFTKRKKG